MTCVDDLYINSLVQDYIISSFALSKTLLQSCSKSSTFTQIDDSSGENLGDNSDKNSDAYIGKLCQFKINIALLHIGYEHTLQSMIVV